MGITGNQGRWISVNVCVTAESPTIVLFFECLHHCKELFQRRNRIYKEGAASRKGEQGGDGIHTHHSLPTLRQLCIFIQFQTRMKLVTKLAQLEGEKGQKEVEVQKLMEENVKLTALLDMKEAQLMALNEQCKVMALNASNISASFLSRKRKSWTW